MNFSLARCAAWKLRLNDQGEVEWPDVSGDEEIVYDGEPQTDDSMRRKASLTDIEAVIGSRSGFSRDLCLCGTAIYRATFALYGTSIDQAVGAASVATERPPLRRLFWSQSLSD